MIRLVRTDAKNQDFIKLVGKLDADLSKRDGEDHAFYNQFNSIAAIKYAVVAYENERVLGCGALKEYNSKAIEVKRMYVLINERGKGVATKILTNLEKWAAELNYLYCILETGKRQPEAIALYQKKGYKIVPNYDPYIGIENSLCFKKKIS